MKKTSDSTIDDEPTDEKLVRVQFDSPEYRLRAIDELKIELGLRSRREVYDHATNLLAFVVDALIAGKEIATVDPSAGTYSSLAFPWSVKSVGRRARVVSLQPIKAAELDPVNLNRPEARRAR
jgi:hypothetical protein